MQEKKVQKNIEKSKNIIKRFLEWIGLKEKIHNNIHIKIDLPPFLTGVVGNPKYESSITNQKIKSSKKIKT